MTDFQRWALATVVQAYQKEIKPPDGKMAGTRRRVYYDKTGKLVASFWVHEISFNGVLIEEESTKTKFSNYPYHPGDYRFRTEGDHVSESDYHYVRINNSNLTDTYLQGHHERGYNFTIQFESHDKLSIKDDQTSRVHVYRVTN